jgi:indole-3-glycerol phosphate synthase
MVTNGLRFTQSKSVLKNLARNSFKAIDAGAYEIDNKKEHNYYTHKTISIKKKIQSSPVTPLITEIKYGSPSKGTLADSEMFRVEEIASTMEFAGASGISVLSQPYLFNGSIANVLKARKATTLPILMKDIIVSDIQIKAAKNAGADCVLFIKSVFDKNLAEKDLETLIENASKIGLETILETHDIDEFQEAIKLHHRRPHNIHIIGINNRNLDTLEITLDTTFNILSSVPKSGNTVISESGIKEPDDIKRLSEAGADGFLIGTSLMENPDLIGERINELLTASQ